MSESQDPQIVVDEDWKARAEAEKEAAEAERQRLQTEKEQGDGPQDAGRLPPASFDALINTLAFQALAALGQMPDPQQGHPVVRPDLAKHHIDTLAILQTKTEGNRTPEESQMLTEILHQLRMLFVSVSNQPPEEGE